MAKRQPVADQLAATIQSGKAVAAARVDALLGRLAGGQPGTLTHGQLVASADNPRGSMDPAALTELAQSIRDHGLLQPLGVQLADPDRHPDGGSFGTVNFYEIIYGHRRHQAIGLAIAEGWLSQDWPVRCLIYRGQTPGELAALRLVENLQRVDLTPLEEGVEYDRLITLDPVTWTTETIGQAIGKDRRYVQQRLAIVRKGAEPVKQALATGTITFSQARALTAAEPAVQEQYLQRIERGEQFLDTGPRIAQSLRKSSVPFTFYRFSPLLYTGAILDDEETGESRGADRPQVERLQREWLEAERNRLVAHHPGVEVVAIESFATWCDSGWDARQAHIFTEAPTERVSCPAIVLYLNRSTLEITIIETGLVYAPPAPEPKPAQVSDTVPPRRQNYGARERTKLLQDATLACPRVLSELLVLALLGADQVPLTVKPFLHYSPPEVRHQLGDEVENALREWRQTLVEQTGCQDLFRTDDDDPHPKLLTNDFKDTAAAQNRRDRLRETVCELDDMDLADLQNALLASYLSAGIGHDSADTVDFAGRLAIEPRRHWGIHDAYLATLERPQLAILAQSLQLNPSGRSVAELRELILEASAGLPLEQFPTVPTPPELEFRTRPQGAAQ